MQRTAKICLGGNDNINKQVIKGMKDRGYKIIIQADIEYCIRGMFATFYQNTERGSYVYRKLAEKDCTTVLILHLDNVIKQIRDAGYVVRKAKKVKETTDQLLESLGL